MVEFAHSYGIQLRRSMPYCAQANGQAKSSNEMFIGILQKMMQENPKDWYNLPLETLWVHRTSKRHAIGVSPFLLTYRHDAILPREVTVPSLRVSWKNNLFP